MKISAYLFSLASCLAVCGYTGSQISAQIVPDRTLPVNSVVTPDGNTSVVTGGTGAGGNLFHSFSSFSLPAGSEVYFSNALNVENIFTSVIHTILYKINGLIMHQCHGFTNL